MGGYGSGRNTGRPTVEECQRLVISFLRSKGCFLGQGRSIDIRWTCGARPSGGMFVAVHLDEQGGKLILSFTRGENGHRQEIQLVSIPMRFGGVRWWAICPASGRRCGVLVYGPRYGGFVSVKAAGRLYGSQTEDAMDRARRKRDKAEARYRALTKYARKPTKERLWRQFEEADNRFEAMFAGFVTAKWGGEDWF